MTMLFSPLIENALRLTTHWHKDHVLTKEELSYGIHPIGVGLILCRGGFDETVVAAGLCHDLLDYTLCPKEEIVGACNQAVYELILALTQDHSLHPEKEWEKRKKRYIEAVRHGSSEIKVIAAADQIHTLQTLMTNVSQYGLDYFRCLYRGPEDILWFVDQMCLALGHGFTHSLLEEYDELIDQFVDLLEELDKNPISMPPSLLYDDRLFDFGEPEHETKHPVIESSPVLPVISVNTPIPVEVGRQNQQTMPHGRFESLVSNRLYDQEPEKPAYELLFMPKKKIKPKKSPTSTNAVGTRYLNTQEKKLLLPAAIKLGLSKGSLTSSMLQESLAVNYKVAFRILKELKRLHIIPRADSFKPRPVIKEKALILLKTLVNN